MLPLSCDVTDQASVDAAVAAAAAHFGGIDVLVNNAGIGAQGTVEDNDLDEWRRVFDVNVLGMVRMTRAALPHLRRSRPRGDRQSRLDRVAGPACRGAPATARARERLRADPGDGSRLTPPIASA